MINISFSDLSTPSDTAEPDKQKSGEVKTISGEQRKSDASVPTDRLSMIREMAYRTIPPSLIAEALGEDAEEFVMLVREHDTPEHTAYYEGYLRQLIELKEATIRAAKGGSDAAIEKIVKSLSALNLEIHA